MARGVKAAPKTVHPKRKHSLDAALNAESAYDAGYAAGYAQAKADIRKRFEDDLAALKTD